MLLLNALLVVVRVINVLLPPCNVLSNFRSWWYE